MSLKILVTGAGGAAAIAFLRALDGADVEVHMADMDPLAAGLYLVGQGLRHLVPAAASEEFVEAVLALCVREGIEVVVPTVDAELVPLSLAAERFRANGIVLVCAMPDALADTLDKAALMRAIEPLGHAPRWTVLDATTDVAAFGPAVAKPRFGAGGRGVVVVHQPVDAAGLPRDGSYLLQELLPGEEYSVDTLAAPTGEVWAAVPRVRMKVDSGVAVVARTVVDPLLESIAGEIVDRLALGWVANVQLKRDSRGQPKLLEVNPRFPGTMSLTVAAGINMPILALMLAGAELAGMMLPRPALRYVEVAMVRTWSETWMDPEGFLAARVASSRAA